MTCQEFTDFLSSPKNINDMTRAWRLSMLNHLSGCSSCWGRVKHLSVAALKNMPPEKEAAMDAQCKLMAFHDSQDVEFVEGIKDPTIDMAD